MRGIYEAWQAAACLPGFGFITQKHFREILKIMHDHQKNQLPLCACAQGNSLPVAVPLSDYERPVAAQVQL
jgi:hypothetical protein